MEFNNPMSSRRFSKEPFKKVSEQRNELETKTAEQATSLEEANKKIAELMTEISRLQKLLEESSSSQKTEDKDKQDERFDETNGGMNV